jgi:hypothetical protein
VNNVVGGVQHTFGFTILRDVWAGHLEVHAVSKEELPQGGVVEHTPIIALDTLNHAIELSGDKRNELGDNRKSARLRCKGKVQD